MTSRYRLQRTKPRYRLHWASGHSPKPSLKWVVYDWELICPVAYSETRVGGRALAAFLNKLNGEKA